MGFAAVWILPLSMRTNSSEKAQAAWLSLPEGLRDLPSGTASYTAPGPINDSASITPPWLLLNWAVNNRVPLYKALLPADVRSCGGRPHPALHSGSRRGHAMRLFQLESCVTPRPVHFSLKTTSA